MPSAKESLQLMRENRKSAEIVSRPAPDIMAFDFYLLD